jgi:hypothetical protein
MHDPAADPTFPDTADRLTNRFCQDAKPGGVVPTPTSLRDLLHLLNLDFANPSAGNGTGGNPGFALLGHSSALTARKVSSIAPVAFVFTPPLADGTMPLDYTFLAYDPGELFVEVASYNQHDQQINLYLVLFDKDCAATSAGCTPDDLLTPRQTQGWSNLRIYESSTALGNTIADCRQCHIGAGHDNPTNGDPMILRMQEMESPHTHWFSSATPGGSALLADFHAAHGTSEDYGPIPAALVDASDPGLMASAVAAAGFAMQPNPFHSTAIEQEVVQSAPQQPALNVPPGTSATWQAGFDMAATGQAIPAPYHDVKITDPDKLARMSAAYRGHLTGAPLAVDTRAVFLDSELADMGFAARPGLDGRTLLVVDCQECHHARLDPTLTRERFLVDQLDQMSRDEKDLAIQRLKTPTDTRLTMPPPLFRSISEQERALMIAELSK